MIARDEVIEVGALEGVFFRGEMQVRAEVVNPKLAGPGFFLGGFARPSFNRTSRIAMPRPAERSSFL